MNQLESGADLDDAGGRDSRTFVTRRFSESQYA